MSDSAKRVLIVYYSYTNQTNIAVEIFREELERAGHRVETARLIPAKDFVFPMSPFRLLAICLKTYLRFDQTMDLKVQPEREYLQGFDVIVVGHQPWFLTLSPPVLSFMDGPEGEGFRGKKVVSLITTRETWKLTYKIFKERIEAKGGEVIAGFAYADSGKPPSNMVAAVTYLLTGKDISERWPQRYAPFGLTKETLGEVRQDAANLATRLLGPGVQAVPAG